MVYFSFYGLIVTTMRGVGHFKSGWNLKQILALGVWFVVGNLFLQLSITAWSMQFYVQPSIPASDRMATNFLYRRGANNRNDVNVSVIHKDHSLWLIFLECCHFVPIQQSNSSWTYQSVYKSTGWRWTTVHCWASCTGIVLLDVCVNQFGEFEICSFRQSV